MGNLYSLKFPIPYEQSCNIKAYIFCVDGFKHPIQI